MRIAANLLEHGVGTLGGREGVSSTESSLPRGLRMGVGSAGETHADASNSAARASRASRSERNLKWIHFFLFLNLNCITGLPFLE